MHRCGWLLIALMSLSSGCKTSPEAPAQPDEFRAEFDRRYESWQARVAAVSFSSRTGPYIENPEFEALVALGPRIVPFLVEKLPPDQPDWLMRMAIGDAVRGGVPEDIMDWWQRGPDEGQMEQAYEDWKAAKTEGAETALWTETISFSDAYDRVGRIRTPTKAGEAWLALRAFGVDIIPFANERFREGDYDLYDMVRELTDNQAPEGPTAAPFSDNWRERYFAWWKDNAEHWTVPRPHAATPDNH